MIPSEIDTLFDPVTGCLTAESLWLCKEGKFESRVSNAVERHLINCPLCSDALEGMATQADLPSFKKLVNETEAKISAHVSSNKENTRVSESKKNRSNSYFKASLWVTAAAAVVFIAVLIFPRSDSSSLPLPGGYYELYPADITRGPEEEENLVPAMTFYTEKKFDQAAVKFQNFGSSRAVFFYGNCQLELKQYDNAIEAYDKVILLKNGFEENAAWYRALALICKKDNEPGMHALESIVAKQGDYSDDAARLIKDLK